jgi:hypothetical protein
MGREWSADELIESWTLVGQDWSLVGNKTGATRLGFALLLKFFEIEARFPRAAEELPDAAVGYVRRSGQGRAVDVLGVLMVGTVDQLSPGAGPGRVRLPGVHSRR